MVVSPSQGEVGLPAALGEALVMPGISGPERLHRDLGNVETRSIVMKIGAPVMTVV